MRAVVLALLGVLAGCGPRSETKVGARPSSRDASCAAVTSHLDAFGDMVMSTSGEAQAHRLTYAGFLEMLLSFETASQDLDSELAAVPPAGELASRLRDAHAALDRSVKFARTERETVEGHAAQIAPLAKETQEAWASLRGLCAAKNAAAPPDCRLVRETLGKFDAAESAADHERTLKELGGLKLGPATVKARDRVVQATKSVHSAVSTRVASLGPLPKKWAAVQKDLSTALDGLAATCKGAEGVADSQLVVAERPDPRKLTVLVHVKPPAGIEKALLSLASSSKDPEEKSFYRGRAEGAFGSGFVLVKKVAAGTDTLVVTNRHVVDLGERAGLALADGTSLGAAEVVYTSPVHDLAILRPATKLGVKEGFALATTPAKDQQIVIATGFPGLYARPSYQTTRGYVSNENFKFDDGSHKLQYVQHTAPIDPGSSGGPLTDESGHVLGVNTMKVMGRDSVGLAVPARFVFEVLRVADNVEARHSAPAVRQKLARLSCLGFIAELGAKEPRALALEQMISNHLVGTTGLDDAMALGQEEEFEELWNTDSVRAMRIATLVRLRAAFLGGGGPSMLETCDDLDAGAAGPDVMKYRVRLGNFEVRELTLRWEQGRWKIDGVSELREPTRKSSKRLPPPGPPPATAPPPKKVTPPAKKR